MVRTNIMDESLKMLNGNKIPSLAYGTWLISNDIVDECVKNAISVGYRHIDTAQVYRNEEGVGKGIKASGIKREELFITTKVSAEIKNYEEAKKSIDISLQKLGLDYVDLILIHNRKPWSQQNSPNNFFKENLEVWRALEEAYKDGKVKAIGVSNFLEEDIQNIIDHSEIKPMVNQVLCHIGSTPIGLINYCKKNGIIFESYSPMAHGHADENKEIVKMAEKYQVTTAQMCIKYTLQIGTVSIPKATSLPHMVENTKLDFEISKEDLDYLTKLDNFHYGRDYFMK